MNLRQRLLFEWCLILLIGITTVAIASQWRSTEAFDNLVYDRLSALSRRNPTTISCSSTSMNRALRRSENGRGTDRFMRN